MKINMTNIFMILGFIGAILVAVSILGYRYYSGKTNEEKHEESMNQSKVIESKIDSTKIELKQQKNDIVNQLKEMKENDDSFRQELTEKIKINNIEGDYVQGDKNIYISDKQMNKIKSILLETRITCGLKKGKEAPPGEYWFDPVGGAYSYFISNSGKYGVEFLSPVKFRLLENGNIVIINKFVTNNASDLLGKPISYLKNFNSIEIPIMTIIYGDYFDYLYQLELTIRINNEEIYYGSWIYNNQPFQTGAFNIPLDDFSKRLIENE